MTNSERCRINRMKCDDIWSPAHITILQDNWRVKTTTQIGEMVGKSKNAVVGKAYRLGLRKLGLSAATVLTIHQSTMARIEALHERYEAV